MSKIQEAITQLGGNPISEGGSIEKGQVCFASLSRFFHMGVRLMAVEVEKVGKVKNCNVIVLHVTRTLRKSIA
jgi:hypothetical protein